MSVVVFRIATSAPSYRADDMSGMGAKIDGGRWNEQGVAALYTSENRALACLETVVHLNAGGLPLNRYLVEVTIPDDVWSDREEADVTTLVGWDAEPASMVSISYGTDWLRAGRSAVLVVPSVIAPEEKNILINPDHPDSTKIVAKSIRKWTYDSRMAKP